jgi:hypothetical protein
MNYPIPTSLHEIVNLRQQPVNEELMLCAIAGTIKISRLEGKSLEDITAEVLADDLLLDLNLRRWLSQVMARVWYFVESDSHTGSDRHCDN